MMTVSIEELLEVGDFALFGNCMLREMKRVHSVMKNTILAPFKKAGIEKVELYMV